MRLADDGDHLVLANDAEAMNTLPDLRWQKSQWQT
jgi:hypothetical protein